MKKNIFYKILAIPSFFYNYFYRKRLRVLAYHDVVDYTIFEKHIAFLKSNYNLIDIQTLREYFLENRPLPKKSLLISFDDGDFSVLENGLPALKSYGASACLFVITELINTDKDYWFKLVRKKEGIKGKSSNEVNNIINILKNLSNKERVKEMNRYGQGKRKQLTTEDLNILEQNKVFIANHSHAHPMFNRCTKEELQEDFKLARSKFEEFQLNNGYEYFAYPNGNWDESSENVLKEMDIKIAFLFDHKINKRNINPYRISRIRTNSDMSIDELKVKVSGLHSALQKIKKF